ncbi:hypothetical protein BDV93DRAFT_308818 [Ceratobasidium sp. AG-I]|nr:hypothetical protein BDV93DRAFT_308818 [Ceratobasidium sp. AG-I]
MIQRALRRYLEMEMTMMRKQLGRNENESRMDFSPSSVAQLIKTLKRRLLDERPLPLEGATAMERAVFEFMRDLPVGWKLDMSAVGSVGTPSGLGSTPGTSGGTPGTNGAGPSGTDGSDMIMVQRCEIAAAAQSLILKAYHPFLKKSILEHTSASTSTSSSGSSSTSPAFASPHHAALACSSAAHTLIHASLTAHRLLPRTRPYSFAQQLFGAAVVAASVAITAPTGMVAQIALSDVRGALGVLRELDMVAALGGSGSGRMEGVPGEAVRVVELLVGKAEVAMGVGSSVIGVKRKRGADGGVAAAGWSAEDLGVGFEMPYLGTGVVTCVGDGEPEPETPLEREREGTVAPVPVPVPAPTPVPTQPQVLPPPPTPVVPTERERKADKPSTSKSESKTKISYPRIGVRVRAGKPGKGASVGPVRSRAGSTVTGAGGERGVGSPVVTSVGMGQQNGSAQGVMSQAQSQPPSIQQQPIQQQQQQPGTLPQLTVPHQPSLQVITEQPAPYLSGTSDYPPYQPEPYQMPTYLSTPVRTDYPREFYGYESYDARSGVLPMMPVQNGMGEGMINGMGEYKGEGLGMDGMGEGMMEGGGDAVQSQQQQQQQQQWYRHAAPAGQAQAQAQGQWNGSFDMPAWGAPDPHARGSR